MTATSDIDDGVVVAGAAANAQSRPTYLFGREEFTALNILFAATTLAGLVSVFLGSELLACIAMFVYIAFGWAFRAREVASKERFADSCYYQGFILTLFALLLALGGKGSHTLKSDEIIAQFGLAIWTTFIGMGGRIFIIQFLTTSQDDDEIIRRSIADYTQQLNGEIQTTLSQLRQHRSIIVGSADKIAKQLEGESRRNRFETDQAIKAASGLVVRAAREAMEKLDAGVADIRRKLESLDIPTDTIVRKISTASEGIRSELEHIRAGLQAETATFAQTLRESTAILQATKATLEELGANIRSANETVADAGRQTRTKLDSSKKGLVTTEQTIANIQTLSKSAEQLADRLSQLSGALEKRTKDFTDQFDEIARRNLEGAARVSANLETASTAYLECTDRLTNAIRDAGRSHAASE